MFQFIKTTTSGAAPSRRAREPAGVHIDPAALADSADIDRMAREMGERNEPEADAPGPDVCEESIRRVFQEAAAQADTRSEAIRAPIQKALDRNRHALDERRFDEIPESFGHQLKALQSSLWDLLIAARAAERRWFRTLRRFRDENRLAHEPHQPESLALHVAILVALVLVEGLVNAWIFARVVPGGLLEGWFTALIVAGMNVAFAFGAGNLMRELFHVQRWRRRLGGLVLVGYGLLLGAYTLLVGHWRLALLDKQPDATRQAVHRLIHSTFAIDDAQTLLFLAISIGFALLALWAGLTAADRYPGYTRLWRAHRAALTRIDDLRAEYRAAVYGLWQTKLEEIETTQAAAEEALHGVRENVADWQREDTRYRHIIEQLNAADLYCTRRYRRTNSRIRTAPPPPWWDQAPEARLSPSPLFNPAALAEAIEYASSLNTLWPRLRAKASETRTLLGQAYDEAVAGERAFFADTDARAEQDIRHDTAAVQTPPTEPGTETSPTESEDEPPAIQAPLAGRRGNGKTRPAPKAVANRPH